MKTADLYNEEAERAVVGSIALQPRAIATVIDICEPDQFFNTEYKHLYAAFTELWRLRSPDCGDNEGIDSIIVREHLLRKGLWTTATFKALTDAMQSTPGAINAPYYATLVADKARERSILKSVDKLRRIAGDTTKTADEKAEAMHSIASMVPLSKEGHIVSVSEKAHSIVEWCHESSTGLSTGFIDLDAVLMGLGKGEFIVVAGRASMGKTALALNMALNQAMAGHAIAIFSLEMTAQSLMGRLLSMISKVPLRLIQKNWLTDEQKKAVSDAVETMKTLKLYIDPQPGATPAKLHARAKLLQAQYGIEAVYVDYLQLLECPGEKDRQQQITTICRELLATARSTSLPIVVLSQLNRQLEYRTDHRPRLADLRESGSIEQDTHKVILMHREDYYRQREDQNAIPDGETQCIVAKNRQGPLDTVKLIWVPEYFVFTNWHDHESQPLKQTA